MSTTFAFSAISETPIGFVGNPETQTANTGAEIQLEVTGVKNTVAALTAPQSPKKTAALLDYPQIAIEHAELIDQGKTSVEILSWLSEKLHFTWAKPDHHGAFQTASTPQGDLTHLRAFLAQLRVYWTQANGGSDNHPDFFLADGHFWNKLLGQENMKKADARNDQVHRDWQEMGNDFTKKAQYLKENIGLDIKGDLSKLTGIRIAVGGFDDSDGLYASGTLGGLGVRRMWLNQHGSDVYLSNASYARLCFLA